MIRINTKTNPKMLQNFDNEPFPDVTILTANAKLCLVLAYLSIDSIFFDNLTQPSIDLSYLPEGALIRVLKALYGDELVAYSVQDLEELFLVIEQLKIDDYKDTIMKEIQTNSQLMDNLQIVQFCFRNSLIVDEMKKYHFQNNLRALEDNRNFLSLNRISQHTIVVLLLQFFEEKGQFSHPIINGILENYFNRNNIKAAQFFEEEDIEVLQTIWEIYHHSLSTEKGGKRKANQEEKGVKYSTMSFNKQVHEQTLIEGRNRKILQLKQKIEEKDRIIQKLKKQLCEIKKPKSSQKQGKNHPKIPLITDEQDDEVSILEGVKNSKKEKTLVYSGNFDLSLAEQETGFHRISETKESKTMNRLNSHQRIYRS